MAAKKKTAAVAIDARLTQLRRDFEAHAREEEETIFPGLRRLLTPEDQKVLTSAVQRSGQKLI